MRVPSVFFTTVTSVLRKDTGYQSVQSLSHVWLFATPWTAAHQASLSITSSWSLFKLMSVESVMTSNHLILCRPLLLLPSIFPSIRVFSNGHMNIQMHSFFFFQLDGIAALVLNSCLVINGWTSVATVSIGWVLIILLLMTPPFHSVVLQAWTMSILQCKHHGNSFIFSASPLPILKSTMIIYSLDILSGLPKGTSAFCLSRLPTFPNQIATVQIDCTFCNTDLTTSQ